MICSPSLTGRDSKLPRGYNDGTIVRYNISRNDVFRVFGFDGNVTNTLIHNNTVYVGQGRKPRIVEFWGTDIRTPDGDTGFWVIEQKAGNVTWQDVNSLVRPGVLRMSTLCATPV